MPEATVTSKGRLTVPVEVRRALGLVSGSRVSFVSDAAGGYRMVPIRRSVRDLQGVAAVPDVVGVVSLDDMDDAIAREAGAGLRR